MMPPKKSRAARRQSTEEAEAAPAEPKSTPASTPKKKRPLEVDESDIVEGKRKRNIPVTDQQKLTEWLEEHLEEREETRIAQADVYTQYLESRVMGGSTAVEQHIFYKELKAKFPKGFGVKASSPFCPLIKEKKIRKKVVKVQAESLRLKMKDIIENAIREHGNPVSLTFDFIDENT